jgi:hypothetical protein
MSIASSSTRFLILSACAAALAGCASAPLSYLESEPYFKANYRRYPVTIVSIDGDFSLQRTRPVFAGQHTLVVEAAPVAGFRVARQEAIAFKAQPCTRYYLAAERETSLSQEWKLVVDHTEPVAGCNRAEEIAKSQREGIPLGDIVQSVSNTASK